MVSLQQAASSLIFTDLLQFDEVNRLDATEWQTYIHNLHQVYGKGYHKIYGFLLKLEQKIRVKSQWKQSETHWLLCTPVNSHPRLTRIALNTII